MRRAIFIGTILCFGIVSEVFASSGPANAGYQQGTVLQVDKHQVESPYSGGDNPSDAPLRSTYYAYDVSVEVNCGKYVTHYESAYDYLPSSFKVNQQIPVRVTKHEMYFNLPGDREFKMPIAHKKLLSSANCASSPKL